jgi:hypothetical protein
MGAIPFKTITQILGDDTHNFNFTYPKFLAYAINNASAFATLKFA